MSKSTFDGVPDLPSVDLTPLSILCGSGYCRQKEIRPICQGTRMTNLRGGIRRVPGRLGFEAAVRVATRALAAQRQNPGASKENYSDVTSFSWQCPRAVDGLWVGVRAGVTECSARAIGLIFVRDGVTARWNSRGASIGRSMDS